MKVVIINKSDSIGGAAVVAARLLYSLLDKGVDAKMLVMEGSRPHGDEIEEYGNNHIGKFYFVAERAEIFMRNKLSRPNLFKVSTARFGFDLSKHPDVKDADIIYLNWINQGALSMKSIDKICRLGKPVVWMMHDMWQLTGVCHHSLDCRRYTDQCGCCPLLSSTRENDLSQEILLKKSKLYQYRNITFVAVSRWLAERCSESSLLATRNIPVIPNVFPIDKYGYHRTPNIMSIPADRKVIVAGAARLDDSIKGFELLIEAMNYIYANRRPLAKRLHLMLYGSIRDRSLLDQIPIPTTYLGQIIGGERKISEIYRAADIVLSTSRFETLGGTLVEGIASGCTAVTFGNSGQRDVVEHLSTGYIADYLDTQSIADGIQWAIDNPLDREAQHYAMSHKFSPEVVTTRYLHLFNTLLK